MAYSITHIDDIAGAGPGGSVRFVRPEGLTMTAVGARRGSYEPRGPF